MKAMSFDQMRADHESLIALPCMSVMQGLSTDKSFREHFYLTGYEGLCLAMNHREITRAIISSAVPMDGELLVIGADGACMLWHSVCTELRIRVSALNIADADLLQAAETIMKVNKHISHILCSAECSPEVVGAICKLAHKSRAAVIVDNEGEQMDMTQIEKLGVDFTIGTSKFEGYEPISIVVARRARLVMTEGNARRAEHDIYAMWQESLVGRTSMLAPMA